MPLPSPLDVTLTAEKATECHIDSRLAYAVGGGQATVFMSRTNRGVRS